jgi:hypothetical protein
MVITMSILSLFTYPSLSLRSQGVITVLCDLHIFPCPTNGDVTRVPCVVTLETETSGVLMTINAIRHHLEASCAELTFGTIRRTESPPSNPAPPRPRLGRCPAV